MFTIDKIGRRSSLILGTAIMAITLPLLGILSFNDSYDNSINLQEFRENSWMNENTLQNCHRVLIGMDMSYVIEPEFITHKQKKLTHLSLMEDKTPYPFLPTPLAMTAETQTANTIDFLFDCNHNNGPWSDDSVPSKAAKLILIFLYESGNALASNFIYWITLSEIAPNNIKGNLIGIMIGIHWLSTLILQNMFPNFIGMIFIKHLKYFCINFFYVSDTFSISGIFFLHCVACLIGLFVSFLFIPEDDALLNNKK